MNVKAILVVVGRSGVQSTLNSLTPGIDSLPNLRHPETGFGNAILWEHFAAGTEQAIRAALDEHQVPLVYTVRDPLASMISTITDGKSASVHLDDIEGYIQLAKDYTSYPIRVAHADSMADLATVFSACGLYDEPYPHQIFNQRDPNALITARRNGDMAYLDSAIPDEMADFRSRNLQPWFEQHLPDLMWYA